MRFVVTGGGTGGHIYPALAVIKGLREKDPEAQFLYIGTEKGLEAKIVPQEGIEFKTVTIDKFKRSLSLQTLGAFFKVPKGLWDSYRILKKFKPNAVIGTGGYVCGPVVLAASLLKIPTVIHEQNAYPGITNKILAHFVRGLCVTFSDSIPYFPEKTKIYLTGLPVRPEIISATRETGLLNLGLKPGKFTILVFGGSQGAQSINRAMIGFLKNLSGNKEIQVLHVTGKLTYDETLSALGKEGIQLPEDGNIKIMPYLFNMQDAMAASDLIICRAGAATIAELTARGIPAILIPYPFAAGNHQEHNACSLEKRGAAIVIRDKDLTGETLTDTVIGLYQDKKRLGQMAEKSLELGRPDALEQIINFIWEIL